MQMHLRSLCLQGSALPIRCAIILYLLKSMECVPHTTQTVMRNHSYYKNGDLYCLKCPAGNFVKKDCVQSNTLGVCERCDPGKTFSEYETGLNRCLTCTRCREDQEEFSPCSITKNTACQCKEGTYCPMDSPCDKCLPCRPSCPTGEVVQQSCNITSDMVCVPVTSRLSVRAWIIPVVVIGIGCPAAFCCYVVNCRLSRTHSNLCTSQHNNKGCSDPERASQSQRRVTLDVGSSQSVSVDSLILHGPA